MRLALIAAAAILLVGLFAVMLRRKAQVGEGDNAYLGPPPPPPPAFVQAGNGQMAQSGGAAGVCRKILDANTTAIGLVPNKNAQYVQKGAQVLTDINCGAIHYVEEGAKSVGSAVVSVWNKIF